MTGAKGAYPKTVNRDGGRGEGMCQCTVIENLTGKSVVYGHMIKSPHILRVTNNLLTVLVMTFEAIIFWLTVRIPGQNG